MNTEANKKEIMTLPIIGSFLKKYNYFNNKKD